MVVLSTILLSPFLYGEGGEDVVKNYTKVISNYSSIYATYHFSIVNKDGGVSFSTPGEFYFQDGMFLLKMELSDIYCNGEYKAIYDKTIDEVLLIGHDAENCNMGENPFIVLTSGLSKYSVGGICRVEVKGRKCYKVTLIPHQKNLDHTSVDVEVDSDTYQLVSLTYSAKNGEKYVVDVKSICEGGAREPQFFAIDLDGLPEVEVNDLR